MLIVVLRDQDAAACDVFFDCLAWEESQCVGKLLLQSEDERRVGSGRDRHGRPFIRRRHVGTCEVDSIGRRGRFFAWMCADFVRCGCSLPWSVRALLTCQWVG